MPPFKKVYSYAVMIFLAAFQILILITCLQFFKPPPLTTTLKHNLPSLDSTSPYSEYSLIKSTRHKCIIAINLTGNLAYDDTLLNYVQITTRLMRQSNDIMHVIKVHFSPGCTYGQFVRLINIMIQERQPRYAFAGDDFYILQMPETPPVNTLEIKLPDL